MTVSELKQSLLKSSIRHGVVSIFSGLIEYILFLLLVGNNLYFAYSLSFVAGSVASYLGHKNWAYKDNSRRAGSFYRYLLQIAIYFIFSFCIYKILYFLLDNPALAKLIQQILSFKISILLAYFFTFN